MTLKPSLNRLTHAAPPVESSAKRTTRLAIGAEVLASDGICGELNRIIIDPIAQVLTDLVVVPEHHGALGRLVPAALASPDGPRIRLACTMAQFHALDDAQDIHVLPASSNVWGYGRGEAYSWPYYGLGPGGGAAPIGIRAGVGLDAGADATFTDRVAVGEVQVRRGDLVHATDGWIGSAQGLVIDPRDRHVTHVLLQEGHLWGAKQVAIPIGTALRADDAIWVELTKQQVHDLPPVYLSSSP